MTAHYQFLNTFVAIHSLLLLAFMATAHADLRTSTDYTVTTDTTDAGGQQATSISYANHGSVGGIVGISTVASPAETVKHGYIGQLYEFAVVDTTAPVIEAAIDTATASSTPNADGEDLVFNLRWEGQDDPGRIITGSITLTAGAVANPPSVGFGIRPGSNLVVRFQGQEFSYNDPSIVFRGDEEVDFGTELVGQLRDFNIFTDDDDFIGFEPNLLRGPDGQLYNLVSMVPGTSGQLVASDPDNGAALTYSLDSPVDGLSINPDGSYTFDPSDPAYTSLAEGETLEVVADWTVTDDQGETNSSTLTITLTGTAIPAPTILNLAANSTPQAIHSFTVTFSSRLGTTYTIERSRDLVDWNDLAETVGEENSTEFTDENPILDGNPVFYRARKNSP